MFEHMYTRNRRSSMTVDDEENQKNDILILFSIFTTGLLIAQQKHDFPIRNRNTVGLTMIGPWNRSRSL